MALISLIFRNAVRNRRRSILTILSIAASFCMLGVLMAMYSMFFLHQASPDQALRLIVRNRISFTQPMPLSFENRIRAIPGVRAVTTYDYFGGTYKDARDSNNTFARFAVEPEMLYIVHPDYHLSDAEKYTFSHERDSCIIGKTLADRLGLKIGDRITLVGDIFNVTMNFVVRGIYTSERNNEDMFFQFEYLNQTAFHGNQSFSLMYQLIADGPDSVAPIARAVDDMFRNSDTQTRTESEQSFTLGIISFLGNVKMFLLAVCGALTLTVLLVSANTMAMSVRERVSEVGILKTLGFSRENILILIIGESVTIALIGGVLGFGLAELVVGALRNARANLISLHSLQISPQLALLGAVLAILVGAASSLIPAWGAARRGIIDCLRLAD
ncbi:MAG: FtsX-like permease family protein [Bryobacteraceae bacterium]